MDTNTPDAPPIVPERLVVEWLNHAGDLNGWPASMDVPATATSSRPTRFVTVERTGGTEEPHRSMPLLAIQVWGESSWIVAEAARRQVDGPPHDIRRPALPRVEGGAFSHAGTGVHGLPDAPVFAHFLPTFFRKTHSENT